MNAQSPAESAAPQDRPAGTSHWRWSKWVLLSAASLVSYPVCFVVFMAFFQADWVSDWWAERLGPLFYPLLWLSEEFPSVGAVLGSAAEWVEERLQAFFPADEA